MNGMTRFYGTVLGLACLGVILVSPATEETKRPERPETFQPLERPLRPPYGIRGPRRPRPIEGGNYYYELAEVHKRYGVYDRAIEMLQKAIEQETDAAQRTRYYESLSEVYQMKGEPKEATEPIQKALAEAQTDEERCRYHRILGRIYEEAGDLERARKAYEFIVDKATDDAQKRSAQLNLFRLYHKTGEIEKAIARLQKKLEDNPDDEETLDTLAQIYNSVLREPGRALPVYEKLSRLKPKDTTILNRLVYLYQLDKKYEKAAEVYQRIIEASPSPNKSYYYQHVSRMYLLAGKQEEAIRWAEKSLSEGVARPYTYVSVAQIYLQNNLTEKALELYDRAIQACGRPIEKHQIALRFADIFERNNKEDKAEELYKYVMKEATIASFKSQARSKLITLYQKQGKTSEIEALAAEEKTAPPPDK